MQPTQTSTLVRLDWRAKMTDFYEMDWNSDFIRDLTRPEIEFTRSWTMEGKVGGEFPYVAASGAETHSVTSHPTKPFVTEFEANGFTSKALAMKPAPHFRPNTSWVNMSFETRVIQTGFRTRGLVSTCQGVYEQKQTKSSKLTIGTGHVVVTEINIPDISSRAGGEVESVHGSTFKVTSAVEDVTGNPQAAEQDTGGWLKRLFRRLFGSGDRRAQQQIPEHDPKHDVVSPFSTIRVASMSRKRRGRPMTSLQRYRDTITKGS
jgi:hypothetical protein